MIIENIEKKLHQMQTFIICKYCGNTSLALI